VAAGGSHRFNRPFFFLFWKSVETTILLEITLLSVFFYRQSSNRAISVVDGGGIDEKCGEFIHFSLLFFLKFRLKNRF
jgi:hypothetical protein